MTHKTFAAQRRALRVSQGRIARLVGLSQPMISQFELGNLSLRPDQVIKLENALRQEVLTTTKNAHRVAEMLKASTLTLRS
jgi:transcriptional regulator with XRE-family HTH domain